ncbi:MAG TPA: transaldolase family protein [Candidatus Binataceae bacterium]|nr:transaldolase family protein [Candidatus Binataceae bacterium]
MKIFVDSANPGEIEESLRRGFAAGITTNPSLMSKEERTDFRDHIRRIVKLLGRYDVKIPLSIEVFSSNPKEMVRQAKEFASEFGDYPGLNIKVPIGWNELTVISELKNRGIRVNCTCCMSVNQALMGAAAGADFVSLFYGRIRDIGYDASSVVANVHRLFKEGSVAAQIIVGSIRHIHDINEAFLAGADIVTVPPKFFQQMVSHPKTDEAVNQFLDDFKRWNDGE